MVKHRENRHSSTLVMNDELVSLTEALTLARSCPFLRPNKSDSDRPIRISDDSMLDKIQEDFAGESSSKDTSSRADQQLVEGASSSSSSPLASVSPIPSLPAELSADFYHRQLLASLSLGRRKRKLVQVDEKHRDSRERQSDEDYQPIEHSSTEWESDGGNGRGESEEQQSHAHARHRSHVMSDAEILRRAARGHVKQHDDSDDFIDAPPPSKRRRKAPMTLRSRSDSRIKPRSQRQNASAKRQILQKQQREKLAQLLDDNIARDEEREEEHDPHREHTNSSAKSGDSADDDAAEEKYGHSANHYTHHRSGSRARRCHSKSKSKRNDSPGRLHPEAASLPLVNSNDELGFLDDLLRPTQIAGSLPNRKQKICRNRKARKQRTRKRCRRSVDSESDDYADSGTDAASSTSSGSSASFPMKRQSILLRKKSRSEKWPQSSKPSPVVAVKQLVTPRRCPRQPQPLKPVYREYSFETKRTNRKSMGWSDEDSKTPVAADGGDLNGDDSDVVLVAKQAASELDDIMSCELSQRLPPSTKPLVPLMHALEPSTRYLSLVWGTRRPRKRAPHSMKTGISSLSKKRLSTWKRAEADRLAKVIAGQPKHSQSTSTEVVEDTIVIDEYDSMPSIEEHRDRTARTGPVALSGECATVLPALAAPSPPFSCVSLVPAALQLLRESAKASAARFSVDAVPSAASTGAQYIESTVGRSMRDNLLALFHADDDHALDVLTRYHGSGSLGDPLCDS